LRIRDIAYKRKDIAGIDLVNIVAFALAMSKEELFINAEKEIGESEVRNIEELLKARQKGTPLAYICKEKEFFSESFFVDERVLIPRPETETLVEEALNLINLKKGRLLLLDIGTGPGTIGLTIAKKTGHHVVCADISPEALSVAKKNSLLLNVPDKAGLVCSDLFGAIREDVGFDMILANLPYVSSEELNELMCDVRDFEPEIALNGGKGGFEIYERFIRMLPRYLKGNGHVLCEIGNAAQASTMQKAFEYSGLNVIIKSDLSGKSRVVIGSWINLS